VPCPAHTTKLCGVNAAQRSERPNERIVIREFVSYTIKYMYDNEVY